MSILLAMLNWTGPVEGFNTPFLSGKEKAWISKMLTDAGLLGTHNIEFSGNGYADNWQDADSMSLEVKTFNIDKEYNDTEWILVDTFGEMMMYSEISYPFSRSHDINLAQGYRGAVNEQKAFDFFKDSIIENIQEELYNRSHKFFGLDDDVYKVFRISDDAVIINEVNAGREMDRDGDGGYNYAGWLHWDVDLDWNKIWVEVQE